MTVFLDDGDIRLYHGDVLDVLAEMPSESVDCVVTSPPYWGLRDYGDEGQLGLEPTPDLFVANMVAVFREIKRVLAPHGTCWVNLGDSYAQGPAGRRDHGVEGSGSKLGPTRDGLPNGMEIPASANRPIPPGLKQKDLVGIPWRVAFALQADGWYLRADIIWAKPNPMPESVTDRPTKSHEYVFLLTKEPRYFFDQEAVREAHSPDGRKDTTVVGGNGSIQHRDGERWPNSGRNVRSVWQIATQPYPEAHFATYPEELVRRCVLAGCPVRVCRVCGKPSERVVERESLDGDLGRNQADGASSARRADGSRLTSGTGHRTTENGTVPSFKGSAAETVGWSDCGHNEWRPGVTLDPFIGSGTTCKVARDHGRHSIGIDLSADYLALAARRLQQLSLLT